MARLEALRLAPRRLRQPDGWRRLRWAALGLAAVALTIVAGYPATWLAERIAAQTQGRVLLADASGSLWHGSATLALSAGAGSQTATVLPGRLEWRLAFWPLVTGRAQLAVSHSETMASPVVLTVSPAGWQAQAGAIRLPASMLEGIGAPFNTLRPDGRMRADWTALQGTFSGAMTGHLTLRIEQVSSAVSRLRPLGSYRADIDWTGGGGAGNNSAGNVGNMRLTTLAGPLHLEGSGTLGRNGRFEGQATADPAAEAQLNALLSLLGRRENNVTRLRF